MPDSISDVSLSRIFREGLPAVPSLDEAALEAWLRGLFAEGALAWPGLDLPAETFTRHLASRRAAEGMGAPVQAADFYLACACAARVRGAVEAFERAHVTQVGAILAKLRLSADIVDEVRQVLRAKLFVGRDGATPKIAEYDGRGALASWVRVVALRTAIDILRQGGPVAAPDDDAAEDPATLDAEGAYVKRRYRQHFNDALRRSVAAATPEARELLRLHFTEGLTLDELAARFGVHRATVARRLAAARESLRTEARRLLQVELGLGESELDSLAAFMQSQLDLSLSALAKG